MSIHPSSINARPGSSCRLSLAFRILPFVSLFSICHDNGHVLHSLFHSPRCLAILLCALIDPHLLHWTRPPPSHLPSPLLEPGHLCSVLEPWEARLRLPTIRVFPSSAALALPSHRPAFISACARLLLQFWGRALDQRGFRP